jgi:hypothetical protein
MKMVWGLQLPHGIEAGVDSGGTRKRGCAADGVIPVQFGYEAGGEQDDEDGRERQAA